MLVLANFSMSTDILRVPLHRLPYYPVTLHLPSGRSVTIDNPETTLFSETGRTLIVLRGEQLFIVDVATAEAAETAVG